MKRIDLRCGIGDVQAWIERSGPEHGIHGSSCGDSIELVARSSFRNTWRPRLQGTIRAMDAGSRIDYDFWWPPLIPGVFRVAILVLWLTLFVLGALPSADVPLRHKVLGVLVVGGILAVPLGARRAARGEPERLERFLCSHPGVVPVEQADRQVSPSPPHTAA
jgi:hypothetical protein